MSDAYDLGFGHMCAEVYEGRSSESCAHCDMQNTLSAREPRSQSVPIGEDLS